MSRALRNRVEKLERRRPDIEWERAEARAQFEIDSLIAGCPITLNGERLPLGRLRELFGPDFLVDPRRRLRRR